MLQDANSEINGGQPSGSSNLESNSFQVILPLPPSLSSESNRRGRANRTSLANMSNVGYGCLNGNVRRVTTNTTQIKKNMMKGLSQNNKNQKKPSVCVNTSSVCTNTSSDSVNTTLKKILQLLNLLSRS